MKKLVPEVRYDTQADAAHGVIGIIQTDTLENRQDEQRQRKLRNNAGGYKRENKENVLLDNTRALLCDAGQTLPGHQDFIE